MNLLDLASKHGEYKKISTAKGGEYAGPCPVRSTCAGAGEDRFHIWPEQDDNGTWWCRRCEKGGDAIQFLIEVEGMSFPDACKAVGKELPEQQDMRTPQTRKASASNWQPTAYAAPADAWQEHAEKLVEWSHQQLLALGDGPGTPLAYLAGRGIRKESAIRFLLGWNPGEKGGDLYRAREAWGLETVMKGDKKKKLWLPIGLVIPFYQDAALRRVRIRIPKERRTAEFSTPYYIVPGSSMDTFVIDDNAKGYVIVEAELDAILVAQEAAGLQIGVIAMGNATAKPTAAAAAILTASLHISNALDYDLQADSSKNPGGEAWLWWKNHFPQAERWPVPVGKDPGDAFQAGVNIREWIMAGLPPILALPPAKPTSMPRTSNLGPRTFPLVHTIKAKDGREINITDDPAEYSRLVAEKKIVFTTAEIALVKRAATSPEAVVRILDAKELFPGGNISDVAELKGTNP
jgi:hypothetical protein